MNVLGIDIPPLVMVLINMGAGVYMYVWERWLS